jgi:chromosome segregation ATPase
MKKNKQSMIDDIEEKIHQLKVSKSSDETQLDYLITDLSVWKKKIVELESTLKSDLQFQKQLFETQINDCKQSMIKKKNEKDVYEKNLEGFIQCGTCSTLKSIVGEFNHEEYETFINNSKTFIVENLEAIKDLDSQIAFQQSKVDEIAKLKEDLQNLEFKKREVERNLSSYEDQIQKEERTISSLNAQLDSIKPIEIDENHLIELESNLEDASKIHDALIAKQDQLELIKKRVSDKSIRRELIDYYIPIFEQKVNDLLSFFMEDDPFTFSIKLTEDFDVEGYKNGRKSNIFKFSEGQKGSMNMAFLMAIQYLLQLKNNGTFGLLMIDEILDSALDQSRLNKVIQYLVEISRDKPVLLISHNQSLQQEYFDSIVRVEREFGFTTYIKES